MSAIERHNARAAASWGAGGGAYDEISRGVADAIEHTVRRRSPRSGERILDVATGTGWTARTVAERGAGVIGIDLGEELIAAARAIASRRGFRRRHRIPGGRRRAALLRGW